MKRLLSILFLAVTAALAVAQQGHAFRKVDIRAAYLHLKGDHLAQAGNTSLTAPFVWFNLDSNTKIKPAGWNFYNPLAPGWLEGPAEQAFFAAQFPNTPIAHSPLNKRSVRYWWLNVSDLTDNDFAQLDVAILQVTTPNLTVAPSDREKLRRFVDKGGVLWIDYTYGSLSQTQGGPIAMRTYFPALPTSVAQADYTNPLLRYPNGLTPNEVNVLAVGPQYGVQPINLTNMASSDLTIESAAAVEPLMYNVVGNNGEYSKLKFVTGSGTNVPPSTAYSKIGDGYMVVTTRGVSEGLNRVGNNTNREYYAADPNGQTGGTSAASFYANTVAKFVINAISLSVQSTQSGAGSRKNYSAFVDTGAPLLQTWAAPYATSLGASSYTATPDHSRPPVIYKGMVFSVSDTQVFCHDGDPKNDIDRDGNADDGVQDFNLGNEEDLIFATAPVASTISSAVCVEVPNAAGGVPTDQLLVTTGDGKLLVYPIFDPVTRRCSASETLAPIAALTPGIGGSAALDPATSDFPVAPTVHEGVAYVVDTINNASNYMGRVWQVNLQTLQLVRSNSVGGNAFVFGGTGNAIQKISSSPTVGYIPILDNSGGLDKVMYLPLEEQPTGSVANSGLMSVWVGAKGERPSSVTESGGVVSVLTRAATQGGLPIYMGTSGDPLAVHISLVRTNGTVYTAAEMATLFSGLISESQGTLSLTLAPAAVWPPADIDSENGIRVDYTIDWGQAFPASIGSVERGRLQFATPTTLQRKTVDGIALSPSGTIYVTSSTRKTTPFNWQSTNDYLGSFYAIKEEGRGIFRMVYRWDLYPEHTFSYSGGSQSMPSALPDNDPVQNLSVPGVGSIYPCIGGVFNGTSFQGAPVVRNGDVFVTVNGYKKPVAGPSLGVASASAILCFKDDSSAREIRLGRAISSQAAIVQPDFARSTNPTNPTTYSVLTPGTFRIEQEPGDVGSTIRIDNMMNTQRGQILDSINTSQPIILRETGRPDTIIDPALQNDRWSPLKWYSIFEGMKVRSSAFCSGSTVFMSGSSVVPSILGSGSLNPVGYVTAIKTDFDPNVAQKASQAHIPYDPNPLNFVPVNVIADDNRPYLKQVISMDYLRTGTGWGSTNVDLTNIYPNQLSAWPQVPQNLEERGRTSFDDYLIRLNQCTMRGGSVGPTSISLGVVGGDGLLATWNSSGVFCFKRASTWVADEGRIIQLDPSGNVLYDSSIQSVTGSTGGFTNGANLTKFDRPTRVYPLSDTGDLLVVDSNQNRILRMNPGGSVSRNLTSFSLDKNFVPAGYKSSDPTTFSNPRDASIYVSEVTAANNPFFNPSPLESWRHYLVADQGNSRLVEIVDRFKEDPTTGNIVSQISEGTLLWHSPPAISGKGYTYNSLTRVQTGAGKFVVVAGLGGKAPSRIDSGEPQLSTTVIGDQNPNDVKSSNTGNGGIVIFDSSLPGGYRVFSQFNTPSVDHTRIWDFAAGPPAWSTNTSMDIVARTRVMSNLQSVTASLIPAQVFGAPPQLAIMIADGTGVYEVVANSADPTVLDTRWMLPNWAFRATRRTGGGGGVPTNSNPLGFFPTYARRLDSENIMIVNGFTGKSIDLTTDYSGEVLQFDGRLDPIVGLQGPAYNSQGFSLNSVNLGFNTRSIKLRFGPVEGARGLFLPVFADRR